MQFYICTNLWRLWYTGFEIFFAQYKEYIFLQISQSKFSDVLSAFTCENVIGNTCSTFLCDNILISFSSFALDSIVVRSLNN